MDKKNIIYSIIGVVVLLISLYVVYTLINNTNPPPKKTNEIILYWSKTCLHCKKVEDFLKSNPEIEKKIKIERKEISDRISSADLENKAAICNFDSSDGIPVPFLYFKGECVVGDQPIIDYFNKTAL